MRGKYLLFGVIAACALFCRCVDSTPEFSQEIAYADPTIYVDGEKYYLSGTRKSNPLGFSILESTDLATWHTVHGDSLQMILTKGSGAYGEKGFWAPQFFKDGDTYYFSYTANEQTSLASSGRITGEYTQKNIAPIDGSAKNIDSYIFKDNDGKYYLYHVRFNKGNYLWVAEFDIKSGEIDAESLTKCFDVTEPWERTPNYKSAPIMEGPTVIKKEGVYYLFYSANHFESIDYSVGYATSKSPYGPWTKSKKNPIIHRSIVGENGSGHGDLFEGIDGGYYYVYHVHQNDTVVQPRKTRIVSLDFIPNDQSGVYDIVADPNSVIVPIQKYKKSANRID